MPSVLDQPELAARLCGAVDSDPVFDGNAVVVLPMNDEDGIAECGDGFLGNHPAEVDAVEPLCHEPRGRDEGGNEPAREGSLKRRLVGDEVADLGVGAIEGQRLERGLPARRLRPWRPRPSKRRARRRAPAERPAPGGSQAPRARRAVRRSHPRHGRLPDVPCARRSNISAPEPRAAKSAARGRMSSPSAAIPDRARRGPLAHQALGDVPALQR